MQMYRLHLNELLNFNQTNCLSQTELKRLIYYPSTVLLLCMSECMWWLNIAVSNMFKQTDHK